MPEADFDPNPARYLAVYGDDPKFNAALRDLVKTDIKIGETNSAPANLIMVRYLNVLLTQKEDEIQDRILELQHLIDEIHRIYSSKRYKIGHLVISPIESIISRIKRK